MFNNILFVCVGNICRSPTGEAILKHLRPELTVSSAGLGAVIGHPADQHVQDLLGEHDVPCSHIARQITEHMINSADLILVMENIHRQAIVESSPQARGKVFLLGKWDGEKEVADPFQKPREAFEAMYEEINTYVQSWVNNAL
jgi:protein-tyrosine phosphatase